MIVDIDRLSPDITSQLLDELPRHPCPAKVGCEPVAAAVRRKSVLKFRTLGLESWDKAPISLRKGANNVRFHVLEGCERPRDVSEMNNIFLI